MLRFDRLAMLALATSMLFLPCVAADVVSVKAQAAVAPPKQSAPYVSDKGYQITPPAGWTIHKSDTMTTDVAFAASELDGYSDNVSVYVGKDMSGETLKSLGPSLALYYEFKYDQYQKVSDGYVKVGAEQAYTLDATRILEPGDRKLYFRQLFFIHGGSNYVVTGTALSAHRAMRDGVFTKVFSTFRFTDGMKK